VSEPGPDPPGATEAPDARDLAALNVASAEAAAATLAPLFEGAPRFLARLVAARPFADWDTLFAAARRIAHEMPEGEQVELVDTHPRLGAPPDTVSALSHGEQGYDRADPGAGVDVAAELARLNAAYEARFGFRYCVFVAGRPRAALLPGMTAALAEDRDRELHRALDAVVDIAAARRDAVGPGGRGPGGRGPGGRGPGSGQPGGPRTADAAG
jgi:2-oxo-4-hydroxy-4-carboxy-5-ureidoimidazoline decarboxylase